MSVRSPRHIVVMRGSIRTYGQWLMSIRRTRHRLFAVTALMRSCRETGRSEAATVLGVTVFEITVLGIMAHPQLE